MNKYLMTTFAALMACHTMALQLKPMSPAMRHLRQKEGQTASGPYYLAVGGYCDLFQVWYDPYMNTVYGNDIGCGYGANGLPVLGTVDSDGYDVYLSVGGSGNANLINVDLYDQLVVWGASAGNEPNLYQAGLTISTTPVAPGAGPSLIQ